MTKQVLLRALNVVLVLVLIIKTAENPALRDHVRADVIISSCLFLNIV